MRLTPPATRWCHLTWSTARHHKFLNIAALARFCERTLVRECERIGWRIEAAILPERVQVLVGIPSDISRKEVIRTVRQALAAALRRAGAARTRLVWEEGCWCSFLPNGIAVEAVRRRIRRLQEQ